MNPPTTPDAMSDISRMTKTELQLQVSSLRSQLAEAARRLRARAGDTQRLRDALEALLHPDGLSSKNFRPNMHRAREALAATTPPDAPP